MFLTLLMLVSSMYAQDVVYYDFDRSDWVAEAPPYSPTDNISGVDGEIAGAKYLIDGSDRTSLILVKPGKTINGVTGPENISDLGFTIEMSLVFSCFFVRKNT